MKSYEKNRLSIILTIIIVLFTTSANAHPGRTDANGGHWNRSTGEYHYHTGEYAGKNSSSSSSAKQEAPFSPPEEIEPAPNTGEEKHPSNSIKQEKKSSVSKVVSTIVNWMLLFFLSFWGVFFVLTIIASIVHHIKEKAEKCSPKYNINLLCQKLAELQQCRTEINEIDTKVSKVQIPDAYEIGKDNLPKNKNSRSKWGKSFTLYKTVNGTKLHVQHNCCSATIPHHIYTYRDQNTRNLICKLCGQDYEMPDMTWYENYLSHYNANIKLKILKDKQPVLQKEIDLQHKKCNAFFFKFLIIFSNDAKQKLSEANRKYNEIRAYKTQKNTIGTI